MEVVENELELEVVEPLEYDKERTTLIDADSLVYMACYANDDLSALENAKGVLMDSVEHIVKVCNSGAVTLFLTGNPKIKGCNFRKCIDENYKANRTTKPTILPPLKEWFIEHYKQQGVKVECGVFVEADDLIIDRSNKTKSVIACIDKDIIGNASALVFNYRKNVFIEPDPLMCGVFELMQCIIGDTTDNIKGVQGIGAKRAQALFNPYLEQYRQGGFSGSLATLRETLFNEVVLPLYYREHGELLGYIKAIETMQLVSLKQLKNGVLSLWTPNYFKLEKLKETL